MAHQDIFPPPTDGSITLPETIGYHTNYHPYESIFIFSEEGKSEVTTVFYLKFGRAVDRVAHHVRPGREGSGGQVSAFVALVDTLLYHAVTLGIIRAGHIVSFGSFPFFLILTKRQLAVPYVTGEYSCSHSEINEGHLFSSVTLHLRDPQTSRRRDQVYIV